MLKRTLLVDTEGGTLTVRHLIRNFWNPDSRTAQVINEDGMVDVEFAPKLADVEKVLWRLRRNGYADNYDVVVLDTLTALASTHRHDVIFKRTGLNPEEIAPNILKLGSEQRDWGVASDNLIIILRQFRSLPCLTNF